MKLVQEHDHMMILSTGSGDIQKVGCRIKIRRKGDHFQVPHSQVPSIQYQGETEELLLRRSDDSPAEVLEHWCVKTGGGSETC